MPQSKCTRPCANLAERFLLPMLHRTSNAFYVGTARAAVISKKMCNKRIRRPTSPWASAPVCTLPLLTTCFGHSYDTQGHEPTDRGKCSNRMMACYHSSALKVPLLTAKFF
jgi:hypothetical protein